MRAGSWSRAPISGGFAALLGAMLAACGGGGAADGGDSAASRQPSAADCNGRGDDLDGLVVEGEQGLELEVLAAEPMPPSVGENAWLVELRGPDGEALLGAADGITVTPHMPDHGHGTPVAVGVEEELVAGTYRFSPVNTFMPGYWQIHVELASSDLNDAATFGVCVE